MIIGGYAVAFHGFVRFTKDIDIYFLCDQANIRRLRGALVDFGFAEQEIPTSVFSQKGDIIKFGIEPVRIDLINDIGGVQFIEAEKRVTRGRYGNIEVNFINLIDLLNNKLSTGRPQDKVDAEKLERMQKK
jgi:hypothetical protein